MKKIIAGLIAGLFLVSMATALTVESDAISTNTGGTTGKFTKTKTPLVKQVRLNGWETKITPYPAGTATAECRMVFVPGTTTTESYVYFIGKTTLGAAVFRTLQFHVGTMDAVSQQ